MEKRRCEDGEGSRSLFKADVSSGWDLVSEESATRRPSHQTNDVCRDFRSDGVDAEFQANLPVIALL